MSRERDTFNSMVSVAGDPKTPLTVEEIKALAWASRVIEAAEIFASDDFCCEIGGNVEGDKSIIFQRKDTSITLGDCRKLRKALRGEE